jgi:hypothetical protein
MDSRVTLTIASGGSLIGAKHANYNLAYELHTLQLTTTPATIQKSPLAKQLH